MRSTGPGLRVPSLATASHPARARRTASRRGLGLALAALCAVCLAAPRAEARSLIDYMVPVLRMDLGPAWRFQPDGVQTALTLNLDAGVARSPLHDPFIVLGEIGYSYTRDHTHAFTAGVGLGAGYQFIANAYVIPRLVVGVDDGRTAVGMRTGLAGAFFMDIFTVEVSHQFLHVGPGRPEHEARLTFGANIGTLIAWFVPGF